ncbi:MAG: UvrD-helicase domain-containing protein, partial [Phycisphaeraceae bacterium]|nr:UvrD-helicase domain-containing protein [Phycisphaeraceae bacterium]
MSVASPKPLTHLIVRASAGAGKTYQLTTRYLDLLARHEPTQNILATTFTRKAAGEVMDRVLGRLASACSDGHERRSLGQALAQRDLSRTDCVAMLRCVTESLHRLSIGTIDSFFNRAARAMAMDLGLPPDPRLIDEGSPLAQQMRFDAIQAVLGEHADNDQGLTTLIEMLRRLHHDTAQRSVTEAMDHIVKDLGDVYRSYPDRSLWDQLPDTGRLSADLLNTAVGALDQMAPHLPLTKAGEFNKGFKKAYEGMLADARAGYWDSFLSNGLIKKLLAGETAFSRIELSDDWLMAIKPLMIHAKAVRLGGLADQTRATFGLLEMFDRHYRATRYAQRTLLFSDLTHLLAQGLPGLGEAGVEELCYRLDAKVTHLLLDEFQDTSLRQWDVLRPFAEQIAATSDGSRSLFCVGDTKQAIYGWRGGCAELFDAVQGYAGVEPATLSKSYRSSQVVLDAVNQVFTNLVGNAVLGDCQHAAAQWQQGFELHEAVHGDLPGHVVLHTTTNNGGNDTADTGDDDAPAPPDQHAHDVAGYIK